MSDATMLETTSHRDTVASATALSALVRGRADAGETAGMVSADVVEGLASAGMFRLGLPAALGGVEADPVTIVETVEAIARADGSTAWVAATGNISLFLAWLDQDVAARLLDGRPDQPVASSFTPGGQGVEVDGGFRVSGTWSYVSGAPYAKLFMLAFVVADADGTPRMAGGQPVMRWAMVSADQVRVLPTWKDAAGMRATGSHDIVVEGVVVPAEHTLMPMFEPPRVEGALYRLPFFQILRTLLVGVPLGVARRALDDVTEFAAQKIRDGAPVAADPDVQIRLAEVEAAVRAARCHVLEVTERVWAVVRAGDEVTVALRTECALAAQFAMRSAVDAVTVAFSIAGVGASRAGDTIQRCWRDVTVASQHIAFTRARWRGAGQVLLGQEVNPFFL
jgi:alkylation response protein AidB-like acyl-CoA dehydrogenase